MRPGPISLVIGCSSRHHREESEPPNYVGLAPISPAAPVTADAAEARVRFPGLRRLYPQVRMVRMTVLFDRTCEGLSDICRDGVAATGSDGRCRTSLRGRNRGPERCGGAAGYGDLVVGCGRTRFGRGGLCRLRRVRVADRQSWLGIFTSHSGDLAVSQGAVRCFGRTP